MRAERALHPSPCTARARERAAQGFSTRRARVLRAAVVQWYRCEALDVYPRGFFRQGNMRASERREECERDRERTVLVWELKVTRSDFFLNGLAGEKERIVVLYLFLP